MTATALPTAMMNEYEEEATTFAHGIFAHLTCTLTIFKMRWERSIIYDRVHCYILALFFSVLCSALIFVERGGQPASSIRASIAAS